MTNLKFKHINHHNSYEFNNICGDFLKTIDVRQIVKIEHSSSHGGSSGRDYSVVILYLDLADVRDLKIDNILEDDKKI